MANKLFGTDGIRGIANTELPPELAFRLGFALGRFLAGGQAHPRFVIGRDTRRSGTMLQAALVAGITAAGGDALLAGVVPTPAVAFLVTELQASGGVVISASHNPPEYNGLKVFSGEGFKLPDALEARIEDFLLSDDAWPGVSGGDASLLDARMTGSAIGREHEISGAAERYVAHDTEVFTRTGSMRPLEGLRIAVDCGHGASYLTTPTAFTCLGAQVTAINAEFSGDDINVGCGSTHLEPLVELMRQGDFDLGVAHDGDADRLLAVDEQGTALDGDQIMALCAADLHERGELTGDTVVATVMSNLGFEKALEARGIGLRKAGVGDRYVLEEMRACGAVMGGEQSGHIIFLQHNTTGDGLLTALALAHIVAASDRPLSQLASEAMRRYPQELVNVQVTDKGALDGHEIIEAAVAAAEADLQGQGRVLLRASGTEPLVRVMVEAADAQVAREVCERLAAVVEQELS